MNIEKTLFNLQRFQIIRSKINPETRDYISDEYAYAWNVSLYPFMEESELHFDFEKYFKITKEEIDKVTEFADIEWRKKKYYSFYEYEDIFVRGLNPPVKSDRFSLIAIFRYMYLKGTFDDTFWDTLVENKKCPIEAFSITREFSIEELSLL